MAVPKRRVSSTRRDKRRSSVWKMDAPELTKCPKCGEYTRPHRMCKACGYYNGRQVVAVKEDYIRSFDREGFNGPSLFFLKQKNLREIL